MGEKSINSLFLEAAERAAQRTEDVRVVFSILVESTLTYRDHVMQTAGRTVTVAHVRTALKWLVPVLATGELPLERNEISFGLLKIWIEELSALGYPKVRF